MKALSMFRNLVFAALFMTELVGATPDAARQAFDEGKDAYQNKRYQQAAESFRRSVALEPASGAYHNLGNAEWKQGRVGHAILAWERALWLDPGNDLATASLLFARQSAHLQKPLPAWHESYSMWLPMSSWPVLAVLSLGMALCVAFLPRLFQTVAWERRQGLATGLFAAFLLTVPGLLGVHTRARLGCVVGSEVILRMTPTAEAEAIRKLRAGEMAVAGGKRSEYVFIQTSDASGWVRKSEFETLITAPQQTGG